MGFKPDSVLTFRVILRGSRYQTESQWTAFTRQLTERLDALPDVTSTGAISFLPLTMAGRTTGVSIEGEPPLAPGESRFGVTQRTRELGIRAALGAQRGALLRLVLAQGAWLTVIGVATGTLAALALSRFMSTLLFDVGTRDPLAFASVDVLLVAVAMAASFIPARRATRVDATTALRIM